MCKFGYLKMKLKKERIDALVHPLAKKILYDKRKRTKKSLGELLEYAIKNTYQSLETELRMIREQKKIMAVKITELSNREDDLLSELQETITKEELEEIKMRVGI